MVVYCSVIILILILGFPAQRYNSKFRLSQGVTLDRGQRPKNNYGFLIYLLFLIFVFVGGFRYYVGTDFGGYYKLYIFTWSEVKEAFRTFDEPGMKLISYLSRLIWNDGVSVIFTSCLITTIFVFIGISKYDDNDITLMLIAYVLCAGWTFSFNGIRQAIAASIIFAFSKPSKNQWILKYIIAIFIAFLFHKSALMMLPILLLSNRKVDKKQITIVILSAVIITQLFDILLGFMGADASNQDALAYIQRQINPIRVVVAFAPLILLLFIEDREAYFNDNSFIANLVIWNAVLSLTTMNSAFLNRFTQYTSMFLMAYLPSTLKRLRKKDKIFVTVFIILLYFLFFVYEMYKGNSYIWQWSFSHFGEY